MKAAQMVKLFCLTGLWRCWLALGLCLAGLPCSSQALAVQEVIRFDSAQVVYHPDPDPSRIFHEGAESWSWQSVRLPDSWIRHVPARQGVAHYRWVFEALPTWGAQERLSVFIPRAGNRFAVHLNKQLLGATGDLMDRNADHVNEPHQFVVPADLLQAHGNVLEIEVHGELARYAGLSEVWLGPNQIIRPMYASRVFWQNGGALVIVVLALIIGLLALSFGVVMGARVQVFFGVAAIFWGVRNSYVLLTAPWLPHPWWGIGLDVLYGTAVVLLAYSILLTLRVKSRFSIVVLSLIMLATLVLPLGYGLTGSFAYRQVWLSSLVVGVALVVGVVVRQWWRVKSFESSVLFVSSLLALALALYDHLAIVYLPSGYGNFALARFAFLFILIAMSALLMRRVWRSINVAKRLRTRVQTRLVRAGALISRYHNEREKQKVLEAELNERMRLMRELHDGVGGHLVTLHSMLRNPNASRDDLENQVSQAGLALRDSFDALHEASLDWTALFAKLRGVIELRLKHAGIELRWQVQKLENLPLPSPDAQRYLRMLVTECVTNVIKHSGASQFTVHASHELPGSPYQWGARFSDNGCGLHHHKASGYGMANMRNHAQRLHAQLNVVDLHPGTAIEVLFFRPVE